MDLAESAITIDWKHEYLGFWDHKPTWDELIGRHGPRGYPVARLTGVEPSAIEWEQVDFDGVELSMFGGLDPAAHHRPRIHRQVHPPRVEALLPQTAQGGMNAV